MSKKTGYSILINSNGFEVKADRKTLCECKKFIDQLKKVGYDTGFALIRSNESNEILCQIKLNDND